MTVRALISLFYVSPWMLAKADRTRVRRILGRRAAAAAVCRFIRSSGALEVVATCDPNQAEQEANAQPVPPDPEEMPTTVALILQQACPCA
jgi:hypothetical protein